MPTEAYAAARSQLASVVSSRAAARMLDAALAGVDVSSEAVTPRQMRALITGPVQHDLRRILPPEGSNRIVRQVMERLKAMPDSATPSPSGTPTAPPVTDAPRTPAATPARPDEARPAPAAPSEPAGAVTLARPVATPKPAPLAAARLSDPDVERMALSFARLDDVLGVTVVRQGQVRFHRGTGIAADRAAALVPVAAAVLARRGAWRSYTLEHDRGHLFILPVGTDHLVVVGRTAFNLGAVLTALATLEEEL